MQASRVRRLASAAAVTPTAQLAKQELLKQQWNVLGAGAVGTLWAATLCRAAERAAGKDQGEARAAACKLLLRADAWEALGKPAQGSVTVEELFCSATGSATTTAAPAAAAAQSPPVSTTTSSEADEDDMGLNLASLASRSSDPQHRRRWDVHVPLDSAGKKKEAWSTLEEEREGDISRLLLTTKAYDVNEALQSVRRRLTEDAVVLIMCNGIGAYEDAMGDESLGLGTKKVMLASTTNGVFMPKRFSVAHTGVGVTWVGKAPGGQATPEEVEEVVRSLSQSGLEVKSSGRMMHKLWYKLAANCAINGVAAILGARNGLLGHPRAAGLVEQICEEVVMVMPADERGDKPAVEEVHRFVQEVIKHTAKNLCSMAQDVFALRPTEVEYMNGFVHRKAVRMGKEAPLNGVIRDLVLLKQVQVADEQLQQQRS